MWTRRQFLSRSSLALIGTASTSLAFTGDSGERGEAIPDGSAAKGMITPDTDQAIERGLAYLASRRNTIGQLYGSFGTGNYTGNVAVTSLGGLAFMAAGHQPNRGLHGAIVTDALRFVLACRDNDPQFLKYKGFLNYHGGTPFGPMYGHGFGTLFLAEVSGMVQDPELRKKTNDALHAAVALILNTQNAEGGWRYTPGTREADISVTICQIMALRAARNAGVFVPKPQVDKCVEYVKNCQDRREGWFRYMAQGGPGEKDAFARTAAGVVALNTAGIYDGPEIERGLAYLLEKRTTRRGMGGNIWQGPDMYYFYGHYYAVQAMWTAGGEYWKKWFPGIRDELLQSQQKDGSWLDQISPHYATAMACIILQMPNNYLPIMQK
jgi:Squalene-hopene cyclase C-terminal domain